MTWPTSEVEDSMESEAQELNRRCRYLLAVEGHYTDGAGDRTGVVGRIRGRTWHEGDIYIYVGTPDLELRVKFWHGREWVFRCGHFGRADGPLTVDAKKILTTLRTRQVLDDLADV